MLTRTKKQEIHEFLQEFPAVGIIGPRQCGKSTLAKQILKGHESSIYIDLENPDDKAQLQNPTLFFERNRDMLLCLDEIQLEPELLTNIRSIIDQREQPGQFLILGSASPDLLKRTSETLAGRIAYVEMAPFSPEEILLNQAGSIQDLWMRGGFPRSYLASSDKMSFSWRQNFIRTFLERDLNLWGIGTDSEAMRRFWRMCAHLHGQQVNYSKVGKSLGVSHSTARHYMDVMEQTYMMKRIEPYHKNLGKRIVKSPKFFLSDSGILHTLLGIRNDNDLLGHPVAGFSWEGFVFHAIDHCVPDAEINYLKTRKQAEIDLLVTLNNQLIAVECKLSRSPHLNQGNYKLMEELNVSKGYIVAPVDHSFPVKENTDVVPLETLLDELGS